MITMFGYQSKALYFLKYVFVKTDIFFNVMDIVSQLKDKGIPITVPFCMTKIVLFIYIIIIIKYVLIYSIAFSIVVLKCINKNLIHMNIVIRYICWKNTKRGGGESVF